MSVHKPKICLACSAGGHLRELQLAIGDIPNNSELLLAHFKNNFYKSIHERQRTCVPSKFSTC